MNIWDYQNDLMRQGPARPATAGAYGISENAMGYGNDGDPHSQVPNYGNANMFGVQSDLDGPAVQGMGTRDPTSLMSYGVQGNTGKAPPTPPELPKTMPNYGDASGFANAGMQAPALPDAMGNIMGLMKMAGAQNQPKQMIQPQQGNLMNYLQQLGAL